MAWIATKTSAGDGNWNTAGTWTPSGVPGQDDYVEVQHDVALDTDGLFAGLYLYGGVLTLNAGKTLTVKDAAGTHPGNAHIRISNASGSGLHSHGTASSPCVIKSVNANPANRIRMSIDDVPGVDSRSLDMEYVELRDFAIFLGNDDYMVWFNTGDPTNDGIASIPAPIRREQQMTSHYIQGRPYGRVYRDGGQAGTLEVSALIPWSSFDWQVIADMRDTGAKVCFLSHFVTMPKAYIEAATPGQRDGLYIPYRLTLIEVR